LFGVSQGSLGFGATAGQPASVVSMQNQKLPEAQSGNELQAQHSPAYVHMPPGCEHDIVFGLLGLKTGGATPGQVTAPPPPDCPPCPAVPAAPLAPAV